MKKAYVIRIKPNGEIAPVEVDREDLLAELQKLVGGYIQVCPQNPLGLLGRAQRLVINEEGKLTGLPYNPTATQIYGAPADHIVGDALIVKEVPNDIAPFDSLKYVERDIIAPLKYRLAKSLEAHDDE